MKTTFNQQPAIIWFRFSLFFVLAMGGMAGSANGQSEARLVLAAYQETADESTPLVQDSKPTTGPTTGLVTEERINSINDRISLIKKMVAKKRELEEAEKQKAVDLLVEQAKVDATPKPIPNSEVAEAEIPSVENDDPKEEESDPANDSMVISGTPVVAQPINPFKLANSLFRTGNVKASRKSYEAGLAEASGEEKAWLQCFIACCYRLEGNFEKAETTFRELVNRQSQSHATQYAKWCLEYLEARRGSIGQYKQIEAEIDGELAKLVASVCDHFVGLANF
jgi:TolA-binding protein